MVDTDHNIIVGVKDPNMIALNGNLTRLTARALMYLVLVPANPASPHTPLRYIDQLEHSFTRHIHYCVDQSELSITLHMIELTNENSPFRRAAIDLIGRGFVLWEPHLEVSKVLLGLLDMSSEAAMWVPSQKYGLPLTPVADCCRTARHALESIAR